MTTFVFTEAMEKHEQFEVGKGMKQIPGTYINGDSNPSLDLDTSQPDSNNISSSNSHKEYSNNTSSTDITLPVMAASSNKVNSKSLEELRDEVEKALFTLRGESEMIEEEEGVADLSSWLNIPPALGEMLLQHGEFPATLEFSCTPRYRSTPLDDKLSPIITKATTTDALTTISPTTTSSDPYNFQQKGIGEMTNEAGEGIIRVMKPVGSPVNLPYLLTTPDNPPQGPPPKFSLDTDQQSSCGSLDSLVSWRSAGAEGEAMWESPSPTPTLTPNPTPPFFSSLSGTSLSREDTSKKMFNPGYTPFNSPEETSATRKRMVPMSPSASYQPNHIPPALLPLWSFPSCYHHYVKTPQATHPEACLPASSGADNAKVVGDEGEERRISKQSCRRGSGISSTRIRGESSVGVMASDTKSGSVSDESQLSGAGAGGKETWKGSHSSGAGHYSVGTKGRLGLKSNTRSSRRGISVPYHPSPRKTLIQGVVLRETTRAFRSHRLFPLLKDLAITDHYYKKAAFNVTPLISFLPETTEELVSMYLKRHPEVTPTISSTTPTQQEENSPAVDAVVMDAVAYAHRSLLEKITSEPEHEEREAEREVAVEDMCGRYMEALRSSTPLHLLQARTCQSKDGSEADESSIYAASSGDCAGETKACRNGKGERISASYSLLTLDSLIPPITHLLESCHDNTSLNKDAWDVCDPSRDVSICDSSVPYTLVSPASTNHSPIPQASSTCVCVSYSTCKKKYPLPTSVPRHQPHTQSPRC